MPIHHLLVQLLGCAPDILWAQLQQWLIHHSLDMHMAEKWLVMQGLDLSECLTHLEGDGQCDGLELWLIFMAMNKPINVVMEDAVWSTASEGVDILYLTIALVSTGDGIFCEQDDSEAELEAAALPQPCSQPKGGCLLVSVLEYPQLLDSDNDQTDPKTLMDQDVLAESVLPTSSQAVPCSCPVCDIGLPSGMVLYCHLCAVHPEEHPYECDDCQHTFNNLRELSSHQLNTHRT